MDVYPSRMKSLVAALFAFISVPAAAQVPDSTLLARWVGIHKERSLTLEFYGDTMLVVGDRHPLNYHLTRDSIIATGDTSLAVRYRMAFGKLLLETADDDMITMSPQAPLGRPLIGRWVGDVDTAGVSHLAEIRLSVDRSASWRILPDGKPEYGEWDRQTRKVTLTWTNGGEWSGLYDPLRNTLLLEPVADSTGAVQPGGATGVLRRVFR